ncbi:hypothetical protein FH972_021338 [Carpinus fangiana]|uniref:Uncharacterized protein n=1 Tax=Carpinus fangiana TaxID=176857 RepID=A0A5N6KP96_9ROSI|nr:hypothetical protein FH972_021338 [Carpinus fangiana]
MALLSELLTSLDYPVLAISTPVILLVTYCAYNLFYHPLASVPGPLLGKISPLWLYYHSYVGDEASTIDALHKRYGPVLRVAPYEVDISDGAALAPIYNDKGGFLKAPCYRNFDIDGHASIFSALDPAYRAVRSKAVAAMFATATIRRDGEQLIESCVACLVRRMEEAKSQKGVPFNMLDLSRRLAVDAVTAYLMGRSYGGLDEPDKALSDDNAIQPLSASAFVDAFVAVGRFFLLPNRVFMFLEMVGERVFPDKKADVSMHAVSSFTDTLADEATETDTTYQGRLLQAGVSRHEASAQCKDLMFAGTDSTGTNLATICWHLIRQPAIYGKLREELERGRSADIDNLPYLRATVREGLRHSLANPTRLPRSVPLSGWSFGGYDFPPGTNVGCAAYSMHFDPTVFSEPRAFKPDRWLEGSVTANMLRDNMPFGVGPRQCIARNLATAELHIAVRRIVEADLLAGATTCGFQSDGNDAIKLAEWFNSKVVGHSIDGSVLGKMTLYPGKDENFQGVKRGGWSHFNLPIPMFEHVCSLPLSADVFAQATHPTLPIFAVGLASGHVRAFRLPPIEKTTPKDEHTNGEGGIKVNGRLAHTARARSSSITSTTGPINTVSTIWSTHRHKGSCRALAFSTDGTTLYSAGSDGLIKAADAETGRVVGKVAIPFETSRITNKDAASYPSVLLALSPQTLVLGTDGGTIHIYTLSEHVSPHTPLAKHAVPTATPSQTLRPHRTEFDPTNTEAIAALAALPPSATSTSRTSRAFVSAAGSTLAVTDIRKGVVATSIDQGDVLLAAACVSLAPPRNAPADADRKRKKGARGRNPDEGHDPNDKVLLGSSEGLLTLWNRGEWEDQRSRTAIGGGGLSPMGVDDDAGVDCLAVMPGDEGAPSRTRVVAAGLGSGAVKLIEVRAGWWTADDDGWGGDCQSLVSQGGERRRQRRMGGHGRQR